MLAPSEGLTRALSDRTPLGRLYWWGKLVRWRDSALLATRRGREREGGVGGEPEHCRALGGIERCFSWASNGPIGRLQKLFFEDAATRQDLEAESNAENQRRRTKLEAEYRS